MSKRKVIFSIFSIISIVVIMLATVGAVLLSSRQNALGSVVGTYSVDAVNCTITATYQTAFDSSAISLTSDDGNKTELTFVAQDGERRGKYLTHDPIVLTGTNTSVIFYYVFHNDNEKNGKDMTMTLVDNSARENFDIYYYNVDNTTLSTKNYETKVSTIKSSGSQTVPTASKTVYAQQYTYYYVLLELKDTKSFATYQSAGENNGLQWTLTYASTVGGV